MVQAVVMGDIGWPHLYHVGDEAMTETAVDQLRKRGVDRITLVAADPATATRLHSVPAVSRFHFKLRWPRDWQDSHLEKVLAPLVDYERGSSEAVTVHDAVHDADFVVIAGGGNLTSSYVHQMYERLALVRVARHFGRPVFVTSQTLDSAYRPRDVPIISEIIDGAELFGLRERTSLAVARSLASRPGSTRAVGDDGLLTPMTVAPRSVAEALPDRYFVASFERPTWVADDAVDTYYGVVARALDAAADRLDCTVLLVPHAGSFDPERPKDDIESHRAIASRAERVRALPLMRASEVLAVMAPALCTVSTRYHPLVFGAQLEMPVIGLARTAYTWHRMRGAARQVGAEHHVLPTDVLDDPATFAAVLAETVASGDLVRVVRPASRTRREHQGRWWDEIVAHARAAVGDGTDAALAAPEPDIDDPESVALPPAARGLDALIGATATARAEAEEHAESLRLEVRRGEELRVETERELQRRRDRAVTAERGLAVALHERAESDARADAAEAASSQAEGTLRDLDRLLQQTRAERDGWRSAARSFRSEVQRYRDRRTTRLVDAVSRLFRSR